MAQQDDIIIIKTIESISTPILDYFLNIALVTEISETEGVDLKTGGKPFATSGYEVFKSLSALSDRFTESSMIYKIGKDVFTQKTNVGINQSNVKDFVVIKKSEGETFKECLTRVGYNDTYFVLCNPKQDSDISDVSEWIGNYTKLFMAQSNSSDIKSSDSKEDIGSVLKENNVKRTALYYHADSTQSLAGAMASIMASYPIGGKTASYKNPTNITVEKLTDTEENALKSKNVNFYTNFIGGAGEYSKRTLTSDNGVLSNGEEIQKRVAIDRTVLSLQAGLMDAIVQDIPYDDRGGTIVYDKVNSVYAQLKREGIFAEDSYDEETGETVKSYTINVLPRATVKKYYPDFFADKAFVVETTVQFAGSGKRVVLTLAY